MPIPDTSGVPPFADFDMLKSKINEIVQKYNNLLVNLDTLNVVSLSAKVIEANTITADKMDVSELSAITANLGTITAGLIRGIEIYGSYISTAEGTYPRAEMNVSGNFFAAMNNATDKLTVYSTDGSGSPGISFEDAVSSATINYKTNGLQMVSLKDIALAAVADIILSSSGGNIKVSSWSKFVNNGTGVSLQTELDSKANKSAVSKTVYVSATSGGTATIPMTITNGVVTS